MVQAKKDPKRKGIKILWMLLKGIAPYKIRLLLQAA
jgi:hypothetical protein